MHSHSPTSRLPGEVSGTGIDADTGIGTDTGTESVLLILDTDLTNDIIQVNSLEVAPDGSMLAAGGYQHIRSGTRGEEECLRKCCLTKIMIHDQCYQDV